MNPRDFDPKTGGPRTASNPLDHPGRNARWYLLLLAGMLPVLLAYYWIEWRTFQGFVEAIDGHPQFMQDFVGHYYPMGRQILQSSGPVFGYYYTSFFALLLAPIGALGPHAAMTVWGAVQLACLAALCLVSIRSLPEPSPSGRILCVGLCMTSVPVLHNFKWGQVSVLLTLCVMAAFLAFNANRRVLAGVMLAFAAAIKYYPAVFILCFILKRDVRACAAFGLAALAFYFAFPATVLGLTEWLAFEGAVRAAVADAAWMADDGNSQYVVRVGLRWLEILSGRAPGETAARALAVAGYAVALSCVAAAWLLQRRPSCEKHGLPMVALFLALPFVIKTSWPHYFVYLPLCQAAVFFCAASSFSARNPLGKALRALPLLSMLLSSVFVLNLLPRWSLYSSGGALFLANALLLAAVYAIAVVRPDAPATAAPTDPAPPR